METTNNEALLLLYSTIFYEKTQSPSLRTATDKGEVEKKVHFLCNTSGKSGNVAVVCLIQRPLSPARFLIVLAAHVSVKVRSTASTICSFG